MSRILPAVAVWMLGVVSAASGQVIYEPVRYQYGAGDAVYYYGGSDPAVFARAERERMIQLHVRAAPRAPYVRQQPVRVYSDLVPFRNAALFGFTPADARNEANRNVPLYFRKVDLLEQAVPTHGRGWVVPAQGLPAGQVEIRPYVPRTAPAPAPAPRPILIIPKDLLDEPIRRTDPQSVAMRE